MSIALIKTTSFEKKIINSLNNIPSDIDNNKKLSILILVLFEILYKNNPGVKNKICDYLIKKNILDDDILNSEYSKLKFILSKMIVAMEPKLIKNINDNNTYRHNYNEIEKIANSSFGGVYKVFHKFEESYYAMKKIFITEELLNLNYNFFKEVQIFSKLYHPNIVRYYTSFILLDEASIDDFNNNEITCNDIIESDNDEIEEIENIINNSTSILFIQMELCDYTFRDYIDTYKKNDNEIKILNYFLEILNGLQYLHSLNIIHRDIKPTNIYMLNNVIKIGDFGLSTDKVNKNEELMMSNDIGTDFYNAPEIESGYYNEKIDIYSCGKILLELLITTQTFCEKYKIINNVIYNINNNISNEKYIDIKYEKIIKNSLVSNIDNRYNINELIYDIKTLIKNF
jgi:serine/threonine protein kinase